MSMIPIEICLSASMLWVLVLQSQTWMRTLNSQPYPQIPWTHRSPRLKPPRPVNPWYFKAWVRTCVAHPSTPVAGWQTKPLEAPPDPTRIGLVPQQTTYGWARPDPLPKLPGKWAQPLPGSSTEGGPGGREKEEDSYCSGWMREGRGRKTRFFFLPISCCVAL